MREINIYQKIFRWLIPTFLMIWFGPQNWHIVLFSIWTITALGVIVSYLRSDSVSEARLEFIVMILIVFIKIILSPQDIFSNSDKEQIVVVGKFLKKQNGQFAYQIKSTNKKNAVIWVDVTDSKYNNETVEFRKIREFAILEGDGDSYDIKSFEADEKMFNTSVAYSYKKCYTSDIQIANSYLHAQQFPTQYYEKYGLSVVYKAIVVNNSIIEYADCYNRLFRTEINNNNKYDIDDSVLIKFNINPHIDQSISIIDGISSCNFQGFGFAFSDTIISCEELFDNISQLKKRFFNIVEVTPAKSEKAGLAYYSHLVYDKGKSIGSHWRPMYFYRDDDGCIQYTKGKHFIDSKLENQMLDKNYFGRNAVLVNYNTGEIIKYNLSDSDYQKYKYPIFVSKSNEEIGNNSYSYAKYSPVLFMKNFGLQIAYLAVADSYTEKPLVYEYEVHFIDNKGIKQKAKTYIRLPFEPKDKLIVLPKTNQCLAVDNKFQNEKFYGKFKDGFAFAFSDTVLSYEELITNIPQLKDYADEFK